MTSFRGAVLGCLVFSAWALGPPAFTQAWTSEGPGPITNFDAKLNVGAIQAVTPHPTNADILYIGSVNGGIWKTTNASAASPSWLHQTADQESLSIGVLEHDPLDPSHQTLAAGIARSSSYTRIGGALTGVLRTTNGGSNWTVIGGMQGRNIKGIAPRGNTIVAAVNTAESGACADIGIFRTTDGGASWSQISGSTGSGLPAAAAETLARDPADNSHLFATVRSAPECGDGDSGVYRSNNSGATWTKVSTPAIDGLLGSRDPEGNSKIAVGAAEGVFVGIVNQGALEAIF
jgi:hypothetical protein